MNFSMRIWVMYQPGSSHHGRMPPQGNRPGMPQQGAPGSQQWPVAQSGREQQRPHPQQALQQQQHPQQQDNGQAMRAPTAEEEIEFSRQKVAPHLLSYIDNFQFPYINDVSNYERLQKIGQGTFGEVFKARCKKTGRMVALKKILMENEKEGFPITALREVKMLQQLKHKHVTELIEICSASKSPGRDRSTFYLVFTFCTHDLAGLLSNSNVKLTTSHQKTLMKHLLLGLFQIHRCKILHRDMKAANVLISHDGILKLADFGLARPYSEATTQKHAYTNRVVTLWYRPPELLLGERHYSTAIDMWGAGCIMAELWIRSPIMQGDTEQRQLILISKLCGQISPENWEGVDQLPLYGQMELPTGARRVRERLGPIIKNDDALNLLELFLCLDPRKRISAEKALDDDFFYKDPLPADNVRDLIEIVGQSMFEYTMGRGAHQNRGRAMQQQVSRNQQPPAKKAGEYRDMVF